MNNIPGDGKTFGTHLLHMNFKQIFGHDIPKAFGGADDAAQHAWDKLSPEIKNSLLKGSGIIKAIADDLNASPDFIADIILNKLGTSKEDAANFLATAQETITGVPLATNQDFETSVKNYQEYFKKFDNKFLNAVLSGAAQIISLVANPGSSIAEIVMNIETAYQIIKGIFTKKK